MAKILTGVALIATERDEQINKHHITEAQDVVRNADRQLAFAAYGLLGKAESIDINRDLCECRARCPNGWDGDTWARMWRKPYRERLIMAGALIAAELDRLTNISQLSQPSQQ